MNKSIRTAALLLILLSPLFLRAQNCNFNYLGTKTLYTAPLYNNTPAPLGYSPVFINHVGRHGARHLTKEVNTSYAYKLLTACDSAGKLTIEGRKLKQMVLALDRLERGRVKSISEEGKAELQGIGERMFKYYPQVFAAKPRFNVAITKEIRTKQSADAFLTGLKQSMKDSATINQYNDDTDLRFYDASPGYKTFEESGNWHIHMEQLQQKLNLAAINNQIAEKWIAPDYVKKFTPAETDKLVSDIFGFATIVESLKEEIKKMGLNQNDVNFASLFTCPQLATLSQIDVADDYLKKGPGTNLNGIQIRIAVPLLVNFINTTDEFVKKPSVTAQFRFAHAETISPFATLLGISTASKVSYNLSNLSATWKSSAIIPLSSNIQWIFYNKKGSSELLVKVLLNEKEVHIDGLKTNLFPYYSWNNLRAFYISKLQQLNVGLSDPMDQYLIKVK